MKTSVCSSGAEIKAEGDISSSKQSAKMTFLYVSQAAAKVSYLRHGAVSMWLRYVGQKSNQLVLNVMDTWWLPSASNVSFFFPPLHPDGHAKYIH